jgi:hypothetical protein
MAIRTELNLRLPNSPGALAQVSRVLAEERINVVAMMLEGSGQLRLVVDNHVRCASALRAAHHHVSQRDVLVVAVPHVPGGLAPVLEMVAAAGVNLEYTYGSAADGVGSTTVVLAATDAMKAAAKTGL